MPDDMSLVIETVTDPALAPAVADVAAETFPLACPPHSSPEDIAAHISAVLSSQNFAEWIGDDVHEVIVARLSGRVIGYALLVHAPPADADVAAVVVGDAVTEISKMYVLPDHHGTVHDERPAHRLMAAALAAAHDRGSQTVWLGVNQLNERAQKYYRKMGFRHAGIKTFTMNGAVEHDYVMAQEL
ncbi:GNAT family N-acetyltransferase [Gordonia caeni]|uniref:GNAT family N-acetyltransferase n=1 Tax=Gordonia caeni TaxID=1007097 RepID=A0ABP7P6L3_9ACTN